MVSGGGFLVFYALKHAKKAYIFNQNLITNN